MTGWFGGLSKRWRRPGPLLLLWMGLVLAWPVQAGLISKVQVEPRGEATRLTLEFDGPFEGPQLFLLDKPWRMILDFKGLDARPAASSGGAGVVKGFRFGQPQAGTGRMVIDLLGPANLVESRTYDGEDGGKPRLVIDVAPVPAEVFQAGVKAGKRRLPGTGSAAVPPVAAPSPAPPPDRPKPAPPPDTPKPVTAPAPETAPPAKAGPEAEPVPAQPKPIDVDDRAIQQVQKIRGRLPVVVIDAGHGDHDPGAPSILAGRHEKEATLAIARAIKAELDASGKVKAILTRSTDIFIPLGQRAQIARQNNADLFISIHADSINDPDIRGATVYTLSQKASDKEAEKLAAKENKADIITGINMGGESPDVTNILIDLAQRETLNFSAEFAQIAVKEMSRTMLFRSNFHRFAGFMVLKAPDVPSVLLETGYMSNLEDSRFLFSTDGQKTIAQGLRRSIERYFARRVEN